MNRISHFLLRGANSSSTLFFKSTKTFFLSLLFFCNCLQAVKSPFDISNGPSGIVTGLFAALLGEFAVTSSVPSAGATSVLIQEPIQINFSQAISSSSLDSNIEVLNKSNNSLLSGTITSSGNTIIFQQTTSLSPATEYQVTIKGGSEGIQSTSGGSLGNDYIFSFTTDDFINASGSNGLNINSSNSGSFPSAIAFDEKLFVIWRENNGSGYLHPAFANLNLTDGRIDFGLMNISGIPNNNTSDFNTPNLIVWNSSLYSIYNIGNSTSYTSRYVSAANWNNAVSIPRCATNSTSPTMAEYSGRLIYANSESGCSTGPLVRVYASNDANNWLLIGGAGTSSGINQGGTIGLSPFLITFNNKIYITYVESGNIMVKSSNTDGIWTNVVGGGINDNTPSGTTSISRLIVFNNKLYIIWSEAGMIRVKVYNGNDSSPTWTYIEGGTGVSSGTSTEPFAIVYQSRLYAIWQQSGSAIQIRMKVYNGDDSNPAWTTIDKSGNGLNINSLQSAVNPKLVVYQNRLFGVWAESNRIYLVRLPL